MCWKTYCFYFIRQEENIKSNEHIFHSSKIFKYFSQNPSTFQGLEGGISFSSTFKHFFSFSRIRTHPAEVKVYSNFFVHLSMSANVYLLQLCVLRIFVHIKVGSNKKTSVGQCKTMEDYVQPSDSNPILYGFLLIRWSNNEPVRYGGGQASSCYPTRHGA